MTPLVEKLARNVPSFVINTDYAVGQENALIADLEARDGTVLIAWEHHHIPRIG